MVRFATLFFLIGLVVGIAAYRCYVDYVQESYCDEGSGDKDCGKDCDCLSNCGNPRR